MQIQLRATSNRRYRSWMRQFEQHFGRKPTLEEQCEAHNAARNKSEPNWVSELKLKGDADNSEFENEHGDTPTMQ